MHSATDSAIIRFNQNTTPVGTAAAVVAARLPPPPPPPPPPSTAKAGVLDASATVPGLSFSLNTLGGQTRGSVPEQTIIFGAHMSMKYTIAPNNSYIEGSVVLDRTAW